MKKLISIVTGTRAEYGLLKPIIEQLQSQETFDVRLVVTGSHLSNEFGNTYQEIEKDGIPIDEKIEILMSGDSTSIISKSMGMAMIGFSDYFRKLCPDIVILLGDRYEIHAIASVACINRIPIIHLYGGDITEGAVDNALRHSITKLSHLHFTSTEDARRKVIQMGEEPDKVFNVGAIGVENAVNMKPLSKDEIVKVLGLSTNNPYSMVTFHPVTLDDNSALQQIESLLAACDAFPEITFVFTKANSDASGRIINNEIEKHVSMKRNILLFDSLGMKKYLSAIKYSEFVLGNSSSGLVEVPSFGIPTINIGDRQKGRALATSVINCKPNKNAIIDSIKLAQSVEFVEVAKKTLNPYGDGNTSIKIGSIIGDFLKVDKIDLKKKFYTIGGN